MNKNNQKIIIILRHGGGRLGNQLWLYANIYAYSLEKNYKCLNYSFYNYFRYFNIPSPSLLTKVFEIISHFQPSESHAITYSIYLIYKWLTSLILLINKGALLQHHSDELFFLPPTKNKNKEYQKMLEMLESAGRKIYFDGQNFVNPKGIKKYHKQIIKLLKPRVTIIENINRFLKQFKKNYLVGVHIRQGDYKRFWKGSLYFNQQEIADRLRFYLKYIYKGRKKVIFLLLSDGHIDLSIFKGFNIGIGLGTTIEDLFTLTKCNQIIASKSSFSSFAAYYGGVPLLIFDRKNGLKNKKHYP